jgi:hypothetical protein
MYDSRARFGRLAETSPACLETDFDVRVDLAVLGSLEGTSEVRVPVRGVFGIGIQDVRGDCALASGREVWVQKASDNIGPDASITLSDRKAGKLQVPGRSVCRGFDKYNVSGVTGPVTRFDSRWFNWNAVKRLI